jgi:threonine dehydratase
LAAAENGVPACVVVPHGTVPKKVENMRRFGARIVWCAASLQGRETAAARVASETGARRIDSYTNPRVIAGQGTSALEFLTDIPDIDVLLVPVGGGSLLGGTALALQAIHSKARVIGVEPEMADDAARSFRSGVLTACDRPNTIADGLRVSLSAYTFAIIKEYVEDIVTVSEAGILEAMRLVRSALGIIVEPSSAVPLAALLDGRLQPRFAGKNVGVILTGGNVASE